MTTAALLATKDGQVGLAVFVRRISVSLTVYLFSFGFILMALIDIGVGISSFNGPETSDAVPHAYYAELGSGSIM